MAFGDSEAPTISLTSLMELSIIPLFANSSTKYESEVSVYCLQDMLSCQEFVCFITLCIYGSGISERDIMIQSIKASVFPCAYPFTIFFFFPSLSSKCDEEVSLIAAFRANPSHVAEASNTIGLNNFPQTDSMLSL